MVLEDMKKMPLSNVGHNVRVYVVGNIENLKLVGLIALALVLAVIIGRR
jgi:hypothetical protein